MAAYGVYLFLQIYRFKRKDGYILEFILMGFISASLGLLVPRFAWIVRVVFIEAYTTLYLFFVLNLYFKKQYYIPLLCVASGALVFSIICFFVYPYIMRCYFSITGAITLMVDKESWTKGETNRFTIKQRNCFRKPTTCVYEGPLLDGRPHGIGTWMDTSYQGELLSGYWEDGIPLGPFESMENDTRSLLVNLRIVYGTNGGGKSWLDRIPLNTGVAAVECCVSESLAQSGIRTLHIMCHSMGTRFFLRGFSKVKKAFRKRMVLSPNVSFNNIPIPEDPRDYDDSNKINLTNLILLNPDYEISTFRNDYEEIRSYCPKITVYADHRDLAIRFAFKMLQKKNLGNNIEAISDDSGQTLDVDIIDTGDLDSNMSERHHSFFNINRLMVDDLHDLIVTGKRAEERTSRLKSVGDVYRFSILPSSVVVV
eukprot:gene10781-12560_t